MKNKYKFGTMNMKNNLASIQGPKHEQGGVSINKDIEVEGGESIFDNFVFSDRLPYIKGGGSFSDKAKEIEKRYAKDKSALASKSKMKEMKRLAEEQEALKAELVPQQSKQPQEGGPVEMKLGGAMGAIAGGSAGGNIGGVTPKNAIPWGAIAGAAGGLVNIGRGIFGKAREYDDIELERANWDDASFEEANFDNVDYSEQRVRAGLDTERNRLAGNATIRNNAGSSGQLLANTLMNNNRSSGNLNRLNRESFQNEENTNVGINNQEEQFNVGTANQFSQFNTQGKNRTNLFNTQIGNQETMQNFDIQMMNDANKDAQTQMIFDGLGQVLQTGSNFGDDINKQNMMKAQMGAFTNLSPEQIQSLFPNYANFFNRGGKKINT